MFGVQSEPGGTAMRERTTLFHLASWREHGQRATAEPRPWLKATNYSQYKV